VKIRTDFEFLYPILVGVVICGFIGMIVHDKYIGDPERAIQQERDTASWVAKGVQYINHLVDHTKHHMRVNDVVL
jgi:hypothetical protein